MTTPAQDDDGLGTLQPVIIAEGGQVIFWYGGIAPDTQTLAQSYARLGKDAVRTFPIQVVPDIELVGAPIRATIPGFMVLEDWKSGKTRTVI